MKTGVIPVDRNDKNDRARANDELKKYYCMMAT